MSNDPYAEYAAAYAGGDQFDPRDEEVPEDWFPADDWE